MGGGGGLQPLHGAPLPTPLPSLYIGYTLVIFVVGGSEFDSSWLGSSIFEDREPTIVNGVQLTASQLDDPTKELSTVQT